MRRCYHIALLLIMTGTCSSCALQQKETGDEQKRSTMGNPQNSASSLNVAVPVFPPYTVNLSDFGAVGDGVVLNSESFAKAIANLKNNGGGHLVVSPGIWLTGPIRLQSNIDLHLESGAFIQFSRDYSLFPLTVIDIKGEKEVDSRSPIHGENLENVAVTGEGIIDGGGDAWRQIKKAKVTENDWSSLLLSGGVVNDRGNTWWPSRSAMEGETNVGALRRRGSLNVEEYEPYHQFLRPKMLRLIKCKKLLIENVTFQNPPNWTMNPVLCEDVSIINVTVLNSPAAQNSDALDLESCRRALIRGCIFDVGDDGICLKSGKDAAGRRIGMPTEDVRIEDCTVYHAHGGFTIGSETSGSVRNISVNNCTFIGTDIGLRFKSMRGRGGVVEQISISNIRMMNIPGDAVNFNMFYGGNVPLDEAAVESEPNCPSVSEETPQFRDIHIENLICRGARSAIVLQGLPEMPLQGVTMKNISITSQRGISVTDAENISFENVHVDYKSGDALKTVRVKNSQLELVK